MRGLHHTMYTVAINILDEIIGECKISVQSTLACEAYQTKGGGVRGHALQENLKIDISETESENFFSTSHLH